MVLALSSAENKKEGFGTKNGVKEAIQIRAATTTLAATEDGKPIQGQLRETRQEAKQ